MPPSNSQPMGTVPVITNESRSHPMIRREEIAPPNRIEASAARPARRSIGTLTAPFLEASGDFCPLAAQGDMTDMVTTNDGFRQIGWRLGRMAERSRII